MRRLIAGLLTVVLLCCFTGCGNTDVSGYIVKYDLTAAPKSYDPQIATSSEALLVLENTFEGLLRQGKDGELIPGVATSYTVSDDGLTYTFTLRTDAIWSDGKTPVTAHDFVFAFQRIVMPETSSTGAASFLCVKNAQSVLSGQLPPSALGVHAPDDYTLVVTLDTPNPFFAEVVTSAATMPCNEAFFRSTKGRYGLEPQYLMYNGPYLVEKYNPESKMLLRLNQGYRSGITPVAGGADLFFQYDDKFDEKKPNAVLKTGEEKLMQRFLDGRTDAISVPYNVAADLMQDKDVTIRSFENKVWGLAFNCSTNTFGNEKIRRAFALSFHFAEFSSYFSDNLSPAGAIVPSAVKLLDKPYREIAGAELRTARNTGLAQTLYAEGLAELEVTELSKISILCPNTGNFAAMLSIAQRQLQSSLGVFVNLEPLPMEELTARVKSGDYMLALAPFVADRNNPDAVLGYFASYSTQNIAHYTDPAFDSVLAQAMVAKDITQAAGLYGMAEKMLVDNAVYYPLAYETSYYAASSEVKDLLFSPFSYRIFFKYAYRK